MHEYLQILGDLAMCRKGNYDFLVVSKTAIYLLALFAQCLTSSGAVDVASILRAKESEWKALVESMPIDPKGFGGVQFQAEERASAAFAKILTKTNEETNDAIVADLVAHPEKNKGFEAGYLSAYVDKLMDEGKGEKLRYIFSKFNALLDKYECLDAFGLAQIPDGILIYIDLCEKSDAPLPERSYIVRRRVERLRQDFPALSKQQKSDASFLKQARAWYEQNKAHLQINRDYIGSLPPQGYGGGVGHADLGLFIPKS